MFKNTKCIPCQGGIPPLDKEGIDKLYPLIENEWLVEDNIKLIRSFKFTDFKSAISFVNDIADLAEDEAHHPYIHINYKTIKVILFTHKINGLHENDFLMASKIDKLYKI